MLLGVERGDYCAELGIVRPKRSWGRQLSEAQ